MTRRAALPTTALARFRRAGWLARLATLAGVAAVLLQGALPILHQGGAAASDHRYADYLAVFGDAAKITLCVVADAAPESGKPVSSHHLPSCPICLAAQQASNFLPPVGLAAPIPVQSPTTVAIFALATSHPVVATTDAQPRAPPRAA
jgi:hypothetical protein